MAVLERGGNAFDAAVAAGLVLQVVEPHLNGPGGEVPVIGFSAADGQPFVLDGQGPAPAAATPAYFAGLGLDLVPGTGLLAACVPAAFGTWMLLLRALRHLAAASGDGVCHRLRRERVPHAAGSPAPRSKRSPGLSVSTGPARLRSTWPAACPRRAAGLPTRPSPRSTSASWPRPSRPAPAANGQIEAARETFYSGFVAETITAYLADGRGHGRHRSPQPRPAGRRRPGRLAGQRRAAGDG